MIRSRLPPLSLALVAAVAGKPFANTMLMMLVRIISNLILLMFSPSLFRICLFLPFLLASDLNRIILLFPD